MTEETSKQQIENDQLICPITLELFRDPVRAKDGHVYERQAITRWILQHGTSPLTRQPLQISDLQSDDQLKNLARQRRGSAVSYNSHTEEVTLPPISYVLRKNRQIVPQRNNDNAIHIGQRDWSNGFVIFLIFLSFIFPVSFILGIVIGLKNSFSPEAEITSTYSDQLTTNNSILNSSSNFYFYYTTIQLHLSTDGFYGLEIQSSVNIDGDLYIGSFNASNLSENLSIYQYKDKNYGKILFGNDFQPQKYLLMITTYSCCNTGSFTVLITGPDYVYFT